MAKHLPVLGGFGWRTCWCGCLWKNEWDFKKASLVYHIIDHVIAGELDVLIIEHALLGGRAQG